MNKEIYCDVCKIRISDNLGSFRKYGNKESILCNQCSNYLLPIIKLPEVMIIPVSIESMKLIKITGTYIHPSTYRRRGGRYLAFYITEPVSAITHYAEVTYIVKSVGAESVSLYYREYINKDIMYKMYRLGKIEEMTNPILRGNNSPIQNNKYTTLEKLMNAKYISEL